MQMVPMVQAQAEHVGRAGALTFESLPTAGNPRRFRGTAVLVPAQGLTVVSDMDDTIKVTDVRNIAEAKANTFVRPYRAVAGMPELYAAWQGAHGPRIHFHLVSAGPWQLHEPLRRFTREAGFPDFTWDMRSVDLTEPATLIQETVRPDPQRLYAFKVGRIRALVKRLPQRHFVLVGDSGERNPEAYAAIAAEYPERIDAVYIRDVTGEAQDAPRYARLFPGMQAAGRLRVFRLPDELPRQLAQR